MIKSMLKTPRISGEQPLTTMQREELHRLHTAYQLAFNREKEARDAMNLTISACRAAERELKKAAMELCDFRTLQLLPVPVAGRGTQLLEG